MRAPPPYLREQKHDRGGVVCRVALNHEVEVQANGKEGWVSGLPVCGGKTGSHSFPQLEIIALRVPALHPRLAALCVLHVRTAH